MHETGEPAATSVMGTRPVKQWTDQVKQWMDA